MKKLDVAPEFIESHSLVLSDLVEQYPERNIGFQIEIGAFKNLFPCYKRSGFTPVAEYIEIICFGREKLPEVTMQFLKENKNYILIAILGELRIDDTFLEEGHAKVFSERNMTPSVVECVDGDKCLYLLIPLLGINFERYH